MIEVTTPIKLEPIRTHGSTLLNVEEVAELLKVPVSWVYERPRQVAYLRSHREEVASFLRARAVIPPMPPGVRLIGWNLKEPPIVIEYHAVVIDPAKFASATLGELPECLTNPNRKYGWTVPQLIDRLAQVSVSVVLEHTDGLSEAAQESQIPAGNACSHVVVEHPKSGQSGI